MSAAEDAWSRPGVVPSGKLWKLDVVASGKIVKRHDQRDGYAQRTLV